MTRMVLPGPAGNPEVIAAMFVAARHEYVVSDGQGDPRRWRQSIRPAKFTRGTGSPIGLEVATKGFVRHAFRSDVGPAFRGTVCLGSLGDLGISAFVCDPAEVNRTALDIA